MCLARLWSIWSRRPPPPEGGDDSRGFLSLSHLPAGRVRFIPGVPRPGTFRPQGLITLSTACSPAGLAKARRPTQRVWDSPFRALLRPIRGTPLGASPLLSFPSGRKRPPAATPEVSSDREGARPDPPSRRTGAAEPCPPGIRPFKAFSSTALGPASRSCPSCPFGRKYSLRSTSERGSRGLAYGESGWPLSRLPAFLGFRTLPTRDAS